MDSDKFSDDGHVATLRKTYETKELGAIMGRFFKTVSSRNTGDDE